MTELAAIPVRVLVACNDAVALETAQRVLAHDGDRLLAVTDVAEAIATASSEQPQVAFVDVTMEDESALALVHHLAAVCPGIAVHAMAPSSRIELASQAVSLGAAGLLVSPPTGDGLLQAVGEARARLADAQRRVELEDENARLRKKGELFELIARIARGGARSDAVRGVAQSILDASGAHGVALYAAGDAGSRGPLGAPTTDGECVRLALVGAMRELPAITKTEDLLRLVAAQGARAVPLESPHATLGIVVLDGPDVLREREAAGALDLAIAVLALLDDARARVKDAIKDERGRVYTGAYFQDIAAREIDKAKRYGRRLSVMAIHIEGEATPQAKSEVEETVLSVIRDTDVFATHSENDYFVLLPETGTMGAHACRRRLLVRAEGDRRARSNATTDRRGPVAARPSRGIPLAIGMASFPHDGAALERLVRVAGQRAKDQTQTAVHALGLASLPLPEIVDALVTRPLFGAANGTPFPLDIAIPALLSLATQACREARRGGEATVYVTMQPGLGLVSAARQAVRDATEVAVRVVDVRTLPNAADIEAIVINAEHGTWVCCGRTDKERFRGIHAADPLLADLITHRLVQAAAANLSGNAEAALRNGVAKDSRPPPGPGGPRG
jgi:ActR/RegA family two-component response regulator